MDGVVQGGHRCRRLDTTARDVPDGENKGVTRLGGDDVIPVPANVDSFSPGQVTGGELQAADVREFVWQQRPLKGLGDGPLLTVKGLVLERQLLRQPASPDQLFGCECGS